MVRCLLLQKGRELKKEETKQNLHSKVARSNKTEIEKENREEEEWVEETRYIRSFPSSSEFC